MTTTNQVYFSSLLKQQFPKLTLELENELVKHKVSFRYLSNTKDIWCRDYMPISIEEEQYVLFRYYPTYLKGVPEIRTDNKLTCFKNGISFKYSSIIIDGGNVVKTSNKVILTDRIFAENKLSVGNVSLIKKLEKLLQSEIIIIPTEQGDVVGHADGMVRFLDDKTVLVNDYTKTKSSKSFQNKLYKKLESSNLNIELVPYFPNEKWKPKYNFDVPPANGVYINYLQVENMIFIPQFLNKKEDDIAIDRFSQFFKKVIPINCNQLALGGGLLNCCSWNTN